MIKIDRRIISATLKCTDNYHDQMTLDTFSGDVLLIDDVANGMTVKKRIPLRVSYDDALETVYRLIRSGYLRESHRWCGGFSFCMTSRLKHRHAFMFDAFSHKFIGGFISGIITGIIVTVTGGLVLSYLRARWGI